MTPFRRFLAALTVLALLPWVGVALLLAQDSTVVADKTGIFGPVIDAVFPVVVTFLTSLTVKLVSTANVQFARTSPVVKYVALYLFAMLFNYIGSKVGWAPVDAMAPIFGLSLVQTVAAAMVYRFGSHAVPVVTASGDAFTR